MRSNRRAIHPIACGFANQTFWPIGTPPATSQRGENSHPFVPPHRDSNHRRAAELSMKIAMIAGNTDVVTNHARFCAELATTTV